MYPEQLLSWCRGHLSSSSRDAGSDPSYEMLWLKLDFLVGDLISPWFSAAFGILDFTPKEAFSAITFCSSDSHSTLKCHKKEHCLQFQCLEEQLDTIKKWKILLKMSLLSPKSSDTGNTTDLRLILHSSLGDTLTLWIYRHVAFMSKSNMVLKMWCA